MALVPTTRRGDEVMARDSKRRRRTARHRRGDARRPAGGALRAGGEPLQPLHRRPAARRRARRARAPRRRPAQRDGRARPRGVGGPARRPAHRAHEEASTPSSPLAAVIRGSTPHFDYVSAEVSKGIAAASLSTGVPVAFGVLTTDSIEQAVERAGTKAGNKGWDAAISRDRDGLARARARGAGF